ncbi:MAG: hypothetical protein GF355_03240, partial [Candidatus Eisenbacteria bacterium]|nr:hypothetical protein [Candidatus Eisenbacteria bacterium]
MKRDLERGREQMTPEEEHRVWNRLRASLPEDRDARRGWSPAGWIGRLAVVGGTAMLAVAIWRASEPGPGRPAGDLPGRPPVVELRPPGTLGDSALRAGRGTPGVEARAPDMVLETEEAEPAWKAPVDEIAAGPVAALRVSRKPERSDQDAGKAGVDRAQESADEPQVSLQARATPSPPAGERRTQRRALDMQEYDFVRGNNAFAVEVFRRLSASAGNLALAPFSLSNALAMVYSGARGETAAEIADVLQIRLAPRELHLPISRLRRDLTGGSGEDGVLLEIAGGVWPDDQLEIDRAYVSLIRRHYRAGLQRIDYSRPEKARHIINSWVASKTHERIPELIPAGLLDPSTRLVLGNAVYFLGAWEAPFDSARTGTGGFTRRDQTVLQTPFMQQIDRFRYGDADGLELLELPYKGGRLKLVVLLPETPGGIGPLAENLTVDRLEDWLDDLEPHTVDVRIPRFTLRTPLQLRDILIDMGMPLAFSGKADFSGITNEGS